MISELNTQAVPDTGQAVKVADNVQSLRRDAAGEALAPMDSNAEEPMPAEKLEAVVSVINDHVQNLQRSLQFSIDEDSGRTVITVVDRDTEEVIRQIPSEETLTIATRIQAATAGVIIAEKA